MNVMKLAWEIRRNAALNLNCQLMDIHFGECLRQAHKEIKYRKSEKYSIQTNYYSSNDRGSWCAEIVGKCQKFGLKREFLKKDVEMTSRKMGNVHYTLESGKIYQVQPPFKNRYFLLNNEEVSMEKVLELVS